jgi:hypothetical protein
MNLRPVKTDTADLVCKHSSNADLILVFTGLFIYGEI